MNRSLQIAIWIGVIGFGFVASASGQESSSWKMPNLNPFKKSHPATGSSVNPWVSTNSNSTTTGSSWNMFSPKPQNTPSTWDKMTTSTKNGWYKFKDAVNPFDDANDPPRKSYNPFSLGSKGTTSSKSSGYNGFSSTTSSKPKESSSKFWPWSGKSSESKPQSVNDFLSQQRPE
ncbi:MAG: hypothetical protein ACO1RA_16875 [Planctomycetaceae bacterium]